MGDIPHLTVCSTVTISHLTHHLPTSCNNNAPGPRTSLRIQRELTRLWQDTPPGIWANSEVSSHDFNPRDVFLHGFCTECLLNRIVTITSKRYQKVLKYINSGGPNCKMNERNVRSFIPQLRRIFSRSKYYPFTSPGITEIKTFAFMYVHELHTLPGTASVHVLAWLSYWSQISYFGDFISHDQYSSM